MNDRSERDERDIRIQKFNKREELESKLFLLSDAFCLFVSVNWLAVELLSKLVTSSLSSKSMKIGFYTELDLVVAARNFFFFFWFPLLCNVFVVDVTLMLFSFLLVS